MPSELERVADQVRRSIFGDAWHGPSVLEALNGVDERLASVRAIEGAHSIAEIVAHLDATQRVVLERIEGRGRLEYEAFPPVPASLTAAQWSGMLASLREGALAIERGILGFAGDLNVPLMAGGSSAYNNFVGHAQHNAYHAGQIMLLGKVGRAR